MSFTYTFDNINMGKISNLSMQNGYESDNSEDSFCSSQTTSSSNSADSFNSSDSSNSTCSSNLSNISSTSDLSDPFGSSKYFDINNSSNTYPISSDSINYYRRKKWSRSRTRQSYQTPHKKQNPEINPEMNSEINSLECQMCSNEIGYTSNLSKDTPFVRFLIDKRINFCQLGTSSHIAAFVPVSVSFNSRCCFIPNGKWKGRYR